MRVLFAKGSLVILAVVILGMGIASSASAKEVHIVSGAFGAGELSLTEQSGVAIDQGTGDVYVADTGDDRIAQYDAEGVSLGTLAAATKPTFLAVDNASDGSNGDIYVVEKGDKTVTKLDSLGAPVTSWGKGGRMEGFGEIAGIAVDPSGNLFVLEIDTALQEFNAAGNQTSQCTIPLATFHVKVLFQIGIAVDSAGDVYFGQAEAGAIAKTAKATSSCGLLTEKFEAGRAGDTQGVAVDESDDSVFQDDGQGFGLELRHFSSSGNQIEQKIGLEEGLTKPGQLAVRSDDESLYVADVSNIAIFSVVNIEPPSVTIEPSTEVTGSSAHFHAEIDPEAPESDPPAYNVKYEFHCVPECSGVKLQGAIPARSNAEPVEGTAEHLLPGTEYKAYVTAENVGGVARAPEEPEVGLPFRTGFIAPLIAEEGVAEALASTATIAAVIDPGGTETDYRVQYVTRSQFEASGFAEARETPEEIVAGAEGVPVTVNLTNLALSTSYVARVVATNTAGEAFGEPVAFATHALSPPGLPDGRGYEMVTPADNQGSETYVPFDAGSSFTEDAIRTFYPFDVSVDGSAVTYVGGPTSSGNGSQGEGGGNQYLARRAASGQWTQTDIQPAGYRSPTYWGFSSNLLSGVLSSGEALGVEAPREYEDLYVHDNTTGASQSLFTGTPPYRSPKEFGIAKVSGDPSRLGTYYAGASADFTHQLFEANDALTPESAGGTAASFAEENNLYESVNGQVQAVNILPSGSPAPNAIFGAFGRNGRELDFSHVISSDGARVFWTDLNTNSLYVRENGSKTRLIAKGATYLTASADGSRVLYSKAGDLYEAQIITGVTRDLEPGGGVLGILGASEDLEYVYFVAEAALAGGTPGRSNLYLFHDGETRLITTLGNSKEELNAELGFKEAGSVPAEALPWSAELGSRTAEVTPSGHDLVFTSTRSLTGYDNVIRGTSVSMQEVYVYDEESGALSCASCDPTGQQPANISPVDQLGGFFPISGYPTFQPRVISEDGSRVFFESVEPLLPRAQNGVLNVYEWERDGSGSCELASGCIYLLSTGSSSTPSYLVGASGSGNDVFMITRSQLVPADQNEYNDVYDARVGAMEAPAAPQCTGTGCQGVQTAPPGFATPASVTYAGVGNLAPAAKPAVKAKKKQRCVAKKKKGTVRGKKAAKSKPASCKVKTTAKRARNDKSERGGQ